MVIMWIMMTNIIMIMMIKMTNLLWGLRVPTWLVKNFCWRFSVFFTVIVITASEELEIMNGDSGGEEKLLIEMMTTLFGDKSDDGDDTVWLLTPRLIFECFVLSFEDENDAPSCSFKVMINNNGHKNQCNHVHWSSRQIVPWPFSPVHIHTLCSAQAPDQDY